MLDAGDRRPHQGLLANGNDDVSRGVLTAHPLVLDRAQGAEVWDIDGRRYLDFVGGIGVLNVGHNHPRVVRRSGATWPHQPCGFSGRRVSALSDLAARLNALMGDGCKSVLLTTGAEAVENAVKIARAHTNRPAIVAFRGGFHGRTLLGMTLTGMTSPYQQNFGPFAPASFTRRTPTLRGTSLEDALRAWTNCSLLR